MSGTGAFRPNTTLRHAQCGLNGKKKIGLKRQRIAFPELDFEWKNPDGQRKAISQSSYQMVPRVPGHPFPGYGAGLWPALL
jgi:hypothetical protein